MAAPTPQPRKTPLRRVERGIYERGPASYQVKMMISGQRISETFDSLEDARTFLNAKRASAALDPDFRRIVEARVSKREAGTATLASVLDRYKREVTPLKKGAAPEGHRLEKIKRSDLAKISIYRIAASDILTFLGSLQRDQKGPAKGIALTASSQRKYASLLSHVFTVCRKRWGMKITNPVDEIELPAAGRSRKRRLERGEEERLMEALDSTRNPLVKPLVQLAIETAMRQGELLGLTWRDIRFEGGYGTATLYDTKNGESRIVPLSSRACEILVGLQPDEKKRRGAIFAFSKNSLRTSWDAACARAGLEDLRFHDLRHEATSRLFERGFGAIEAAAVTGHKTMQVLKSYAHLRAEDLAKKLG